MKPASLIPTLQSDALAREIEQQLKEETEAVIASAERDAHAALAQARGDARARMHAAIVELRREGARWRSAKLCRCSTICLKRAGVTRRRAGVGPMCWRDWSEAERRDFAAATAVGKTSEIDFTAATDLAAGLRIKSDAAVLDATPHGLLADRRNIAALLLDEMGERP